MRPISYVNPDMTATLATYALEEVTPTGVLVRSFLFSPTGWDGKSRHLFLTFTPAGIALQGPLLVGPRGRGILSAPEKHFHWFLDDLTEAHLLESFLDKSWQYDVAERDVRALAVKYVGSAAELLALADRLGTNCDPDERTLVKNLSALKIPECDEVGIDYPLSDAGWLCAIHARFLQLARDTN